MDDRLVIQFYHLFHVSAVNLLFVAVSVFIRNHPRFIIGLWLYRQLRLIDHRWYASRNSNQEQALRAKVSIQAEIMAAVFFHLLLLKAIYAIKTHSVTGKIVRLTLFSIRH